MMDFFRMFWKALFSCAHAVNESASAVANVAEIANEETAGLKEQMAVERQARLESLTAKLKAA